MGLWGKARSKILCPVRRVERHEPGMCMPELLSERLGRMAALPKHSLQRLYETHKCQRGGAQSPWPSHLDAIRQAIWWYSQG